MRNVILLGCVLFASAFDVVAPEDATTVRIVSVTHQTAKNAPVQLRLQNIGPAGRFHARAYEYNSTNSSDPRIVYTDEVCSRVPAAIDANTTIDTEIAGCGTHTLDWIVIETSVDGGNKWTRTACYEVRGYSCPSSLERER